jgi:2,3-bisphosphoglycerate-dependent phosphoglycerate mutase
MDSIAHTLVLVRHGQSEDNERELFSGLRDPALTARGVNEARAAGRRLKTLGYRFDHAFTSRLQRAQHTLALILDELTEDLRAGSLAQRGRCRAATERGAPVREALSMG